ncbi:uncharacterized protein TNCV_3773521 [Trichonephila clavipes]|nr:uncharacterized protein TNCV_3773521 [Trichonephila clavipes]
MACQVTRSFANRACLGRQLQPSRDTGELTAQMQRLCPGNIWMDSHGSFLVCSPVLDCLYLGLCFRPLIDNVAASGRCVPQTPITRACGATSKRYLKIGDFDDFKFGNCVFLVDFRKLSVMSCRKQRSAFDQVSEFDRGRIVVYRDCGLSFREIGSRVGRDQTAVIRICDRWMQEGTMDRRG